MATIQTAEIGAQQLSYEGQVLRARDRLNALGYNVLAIMDSDTSPEQILAEDLGIEQISRHYGLVDVLNASIPDTSSEEKVASVVSYYSAGEGHVTLSGNDDTRVLDAIHQTHSKAIARVDVPHGDKKIAVAIVANDHSVRI
jgi:hypothetical protein